jgi:hypothetical protein
VNVATAGRGRINRCRIAQVLALLGALLVLNSTLTFQNVWPTLGIRWVPEFSVELTILLLVLVGTAIRGQLPGKAMRRALVGGYSLFVIGRYLDVTVPALMGRSIDLYWDSQHVVHVAAMFLTSVPLWRLLLAMVALLAVGAALIGLLHWSFAVVLRALAQPADRRWLGTFSLVLLALYGAGRLRVLLPSERWFALPVSDLFVEQTRRVLKATVFQDSRWLNSQPPLPHSDFKRLRHGDVFVWFFESYGALVFDDPRFSTSLAEEFSGLERALTGAGWHSVSARVNSSTFGGSSWLAHSSLLSGLRIADQNDYQSLLASRRDTLVSRFGAAGYRTVAIMPGLKFPWPEGQFYGFDQLYDNQALNYTGPAYGWWAVPDQYSLYRVHQMEITPTERAPLFVFFPTINSHAPFAPLPPYQSNWSQIATTGAAPTPESVALASRLDGEELAGAYRRSVRYNLAVLGGYLRHYAPSTAFLMVLGDHQPPAVVGGRDISWQVPVHLFSRDAALLQTLVDLGFNWGMTPDQGALGSIEALGPLLLRALDGASAAGVRTAFPVTVPPIH